ncbi:uncharacterized protein I206_107757 [Kwoniella pini CBS 10737]|uniref:Uncharacterized protein n=1 Tax=Kwoniella pini CBS 10737 TaxID=1296096 RepID=A0A1B9HY74_9TREE|nr:uncharacterized protein I206_06090 [Kwoniella pini CBS 10737]OCF48222.1 hypothetical protein I206_06090 [Kwoniella pini CBS 10737]
MDDSSDQSRRGQKRRLVNPGMGTSHPGSLDPTDSASIPYNAPPYNWPSYPGYAESGDPSGNRSEQTMYGRPPGTQIHNYSFGDQRIQHEDFSQSAPQTQFTNTLSNARVAGDLHFNYTTEPSASLVTYGQADIDRMWATLTEGIKGQHTGPASNYHDTVLDPFGQQQKPDFTPDLGANPLDAQFVSQQIPNLAHDLEIDPSGITDPAYNPSWSIYPALQAEGSAIAHQHGILEENKPSRDRRETIDYRPMTNKKIKDDFHILITKIMSRAVDPQLPHKSRFDIPENVIESLVADPATQQSQLSEGSESFYNLSPGQNSDIQTTQNNLYRLGKNKDETERMERWLEVFKQGNLVPDAYHIELNLSLSYKKKSFSMKDTTPVTVDHFDLMAKRALAEQDHKSVEAITRTKELWISLNDSSKHTSRVTTDASGFSLAQMQKAFDHSLNDESAAVEAPKAPFNLQEDFDQFLGRDYQ